MQPLPPWDQGGLDVSDMSDLARRPSFIASPPPPLVSAVYKDVSRGCNRPSTGSRQGTSYTNTSCSSVHKAQRGLDGSKIDRQVTGLTLTAPGFYVHYCS